MPELPEVEHITRYLRPRLVGRRVLAVAQPQGPLRRAPGARRLEDLVGRRVDAVERRAKLVLVRLDDGATLALHLKLTGKLWVRPAADAPTRTTRLRLVLDDGQALDDEDARKLGWARLLDPAACARLEAAHGPEPLAPGFGLAAFRARLAGRRGQLKPLLLDPAFVAGVGNIYADEVLFAARLHPRRLAGTLAPAEVAALHRALVGTLRRAVAARTDEVPDQERVGAGGRGAARRIAALQVFQRQGEACRRCGAALVRTVVAGRGTYLCPACQPAPA